MAVRLNLETDKDSKYPKLLKENRILKFYRVLYTYLNFKFFGVLYSKHSADL